MAEPTVDPVQVRAAIDVSLEAAVLPDATIALDLYEGWAIRKVKSLDPLWATRAGEQLEHLNVAAVLFTASLVLYAVPDVVSETYAQNEGYKRTQRDNDALSARLQARAQDEIDEVTNPDEEAGIDARPTLFSRACGRRGR